MPSLSARDRVTRSSNRVGVWDPGSQKNPSWKLLSSVDPKLGMVLLVDKAVVSLYQNMMAVTKTDNKNEYEKTSE